MLKIYVGGLTVNRVKIKDYFTGINEISSRRIKKAFKDKRITINDSKAYWDSWVKNGDVIQITNEQDKNNIEPQKMDINIIFEDKFMLILNKPPFLLVHPTQNFPNGTLANGVSDYYLRTGQEHTIRFFNRLDRDTSGVVILPKDSLIHRKLVDIDIEKFYYAVAEGHLKDKKGVIDAPIGKLYEDDIKLSVMLDGKEALTEYEVIEELRGASLLKLQLKTGRTHQIRVHMKHIGHPILGDTLYNKPSELIARQALHAYRVQFIHPMTGEEMTVTADMPEDMRALIEALKQE